MEQSGQDPPCASGTHQRTDDYSFVPGRSGEREASVTKVHHRHGYSHKQMWSFTARQTSAESQFSPKVCRTPGLNVTCVCASVWRVCRKLRETTNAQKNAQRAAMRAHFRRKYQLSQVGKAPATALSGSSKRSPAPMSMDALILGLKL